MPPSDFLYGQQWQVSESIAAQNRLEANTARKGGPCLSVLSVAGQKYRHHIAGQGSASALRALAALQKTATDGRVARVSYYADFLCVSVSKGVHLFAFIRCMQLLAVCLALMSR